MVETKERPEVHAPRAFVLVKSASMKPEHQSGMWTGRGESLLAAALAVLALAGCRDNMRASPTGAASNMPTRPQGAASAPVVVAEPRAPSAETTLDGTWISPSCGERAYARIITFDGGRFTAEDRVAPCPPGAQCVWSGVVLRTGTYSTEGQVVRLALERPSATSPGAPFPTELALDPGPVEIASADGGASIRCAYAKR